MGFQKCPICNGTGYVQYSGCGNVKCTVCNGEKIINEFTGKPPSNSDSDKNVLGPGNKGHFSDYHKGLMETLNKEDFFKP